MTFLRLDLEDLHRKNPNYVGKIPFPHQTEAFEALSKNFPFPMNGYSGGLLVLPTGGGKTFTAVNWICRNVLSKKIKVIWFAQSSYLLNQAFGSFCDNALEITNCESINLRVVSSSTDHSKVFTINSTDDVIIITTQTAISSFNSQSRDLTGREIKTEFKKFIGNCVNSEIFIVLDEAHHAPAYGFRNLWEEIRNTVPNFYILGLTATPTHNDERIGGWLFKIFNKKVICKADQNKLITQKILALPKYDEKSTGKELVVDDALYDRLVREHKNLPDNIVEMLAEDSARNDYIINDYLKNKNHYGKTIIFADRWPQCVYIKDKLKEKGVNADAVFTKTHDDSNLSSMKNDIYDNLAIIQKFKESKDGVLVNIRMLTEGVDIPDVKSVFLTRQTTSSILMTQMVGRALRGELAGGGPSKDTANIVLFIDNWRGLIDVWAHPGTGLDRHPPPSIGPRPYELISIYLVEQLCKSIDSGTIPDLPYTSYLPIGWYKTEITISTAKDESLREEEKEEMQNFIEYVTVFEHTKDKFDNFIKEKFNEIPESWSDEQLDERSIEPIIIDWMNLYFNPQIDQITGSLVRDLIKISRHIAKNGTIPEFHYFAEREFYDMDRLYLELIDKPDRDRLRDLAFRFDKQGNLWKLFYKDFKKFITAFDFAKNRILLAPEGTNLIIPLPERPKPDIILSVDEIEQIKKRDNFTCQCCLKSGKGVRLEIDHIIPKSRGGEATVENSQTLCSECNSRKGTNAINFKSNISPSLFNLKDPIFFSRARSEHPIHTTARIIDFFYYCQAICAIQWNERKNGKNYSTWIVELYQGNDPKLIEKYKSQLINHMKNELGFKHLEDIKFVTPGH